MAALPGIATVRIAEAASSSSIVNQTTALNSEALRIGNRIGALALGMKAGLIGVEGDPMTDITALQQVVFAMKGGPCGGM